MDIKPTTSPDAPRNVGGPRARTDAADAGTQPRDGAGSVDRLSLTDQARTLLALKNEQPDAPVDGSRVAALRQAVAEGTYRPDADRIAAALIRLETGR